MKISEKNVISICVDVRKSTTFHDVVGNYIIASKIISSFIRDVYIEVRSQNKFFSDNIIYAGDGIIFNIILNDSMNTSTKFFDSVSNCVFLIKQIILRFVSKYKKYDFNAGIGIDYGITVRQKVDEIPNLKNNILYIGKPVPFCTKLCSTVPFKTVKNGIKYIAASEYFISHLSEVEKEKYYMTKSKKKYVER